MLEHVAGTHVPLDGMAAMSELCGVLAGNGSGARMCLVGVGEERWHLGSNTMMRWQSGLRSQFSPHCPPPSPPAPHQACPSSPYHRVLFTPSSLQGNSHPRSKEECLTLDAVKIISVMLLKTWLWVLKSPIHQPCLPTDHFCHHPSPHLSCKRCK